MRHAYFTALTLLAMALASGCTTQAKKEVRSLVETEHQRVKLSKARYKDPLANKYLAIVAGIILDTAKRLDLESEDLEDRDAILDIYDSFEIYIVHDPAPNAWVHGDDFMCITTAAILHAEHPEELAFIIGHEFGHLRGEHVVESVERKYTNKVVAGVVMGLGAMAAGYQASSDPNYSQAQYQRDMQNALAAGQIIVASFEPHRKSDEFESDRFALELMAEAGFPISRSTDWMERSLAIHGDRGGRTHPRTTQRIARLRELIAGYGEITPTRGFNTAQFQQMKNRIRVATVGMMKNDSFQFYSVERALIADGELATIKSCGPTDATAEQIASYFSELLIGAN